MGPTDADMNIELKILDDRLRQQMPEPGGAAPRNLRDEIPPHY